MSAADLTGKVAVITGGARGQGRSHAIALAEAGADVAICDISAPVASTLYRTATADDLAETVMLLEKTGRRIVAVEADVRDRVAMRSFADQVMADLGRVDILVGNAGICSFGSSWELPDEQWDEMLAINLTGVFNTVKAFVPHIVAGGRGGSVVLTSSQAGLEPMAGVAHYIAAKHGVTGYAKALAVELAALNIRVNSVHPCGVRTEMVINQPGLDLFAGREGATFEDAEPAMKALNLLDTALVEPEDVSAAILFLVSDAARYITGVQLPVDAGALQNPAGFWRGAPA